MAVAEANSLEQRTITGPPQTVQFSVATNGRFTVARNSFARRVPRTLWNSLRTNLD